MKTKDKSGDELKRLIQLNGLDNPSDDFTSEVMKEVLAKEESILNPALQSLLKHNQTEALPSNFAHGVMMKIHSPVSINNKPIISRRTWYLAAAAFIGIIIYIGFADKATTSGGFSSYFILAGENAGSLLHTLSSIPLIPRITFIASSALVLLDYFLRVKSRRKKLQS